MDELFSKNYEIKLLKSLEMVQEEESGSERCILTMWTHRGTGTAPKGLVSGPTKPAPVSVRMADLH